jgi:hypothetical protein
MTPSLCQPVIFAPPANTARYAEGKTTVIEDRLSHRLVFAIHNGDKISHQEAQEKFTTAQNIVNALNPNLAQKLAAYNNTGRITIKEAARIDIVEKNTANPSDIKPFPMAGIYDAKTHTLWIAINSYTTPLEIAAVLVHEGTHMTQDIDSGRDPSNTPRVELELEAHHAQFDFMQAKSMDTSSFSGYLDSNGNWSDDQFRQSYTATTITAPSGGQWVPTGEITGMENGP